MDATDDAGRAFIGYSARLDWKSIGLFYNGFTFRSITGAVVKRNSFSSQQFPSVSGEEIVWRFRNVSAKWKRMVAPVHEVLLELPEGNITWSCHAPQALAVVEHTHEQLEKNALGYVEKITLSLPPWKIPIRELHWGRFLSPDHTVVWIRWIGPVPRTLVWHNGARFQDAEITTEAVAFDGLMLSINNKRELRKGSLLSTVFSKFPAIARLFPKTIMQLRENKWVSDGLLMRGNKRIAEGKIIHEHVIW